MEETSGKRAKPGGGEAVVSFFTKLPGQFQVPEDEELVVPSNLARYGLSEVVNRLLGLEKPVPFDFLVDGEFLRGSVGGYLEAHKLSSEKILRLEFVLALREPEQSTVDETPDWIAGVAALQACPSTWFAAVSYDGTVRIYEGSESRMTTRLSDAGLASVAALSVNSSRGSHLVAAGLDGSLRCCALQFGSGAVEVGAVASLCGAGQPKALEAAAISEDGTLLASGGWSQEVFVWNVDPDTFTAPDDTAVGGKRKAAADAEAKRPKFSLKGHTQVVTCLEFGTKARFPYTLLSASWDCSVRVWDTAAASCVCNWPVARAVTSFSLNPVMPPQMATTHEDGHVSLWDIRAPPHTSVAGALSLDASAGLPLAYAQSPHRRLASQAVWCPEDANRIASVGHDGHLCILDPRSPKMPLQTLLVGKQGPMPNKLLCATWLAKDALAVGGSDGKVVRVSLASSEQSDD
eukprot:TRINITY_DN42519_c0_g1_i1.p1 TRINITY_DN42519_c0_g1~~TRINITY_DN42519_c0_g1_i1.p1  ORF type:complete len:470 (-),score=103.29 TRINITY_DN42519_c0_g1_i1:31-1416(-)